MHIHAVCVRETKELFISFAIRLTCKFQRFTAIDDKKYIAHLGLWSYCSKRKFNVSGLFCSSNIRCDN